MGEWGSTLGLTLLRGKYVLYLKSDVRIKIRHRKNPGRTLQEEINMHSEKTTIRLAAVDMDGTLLHDDKSISDYTLDVLRKIVKKGVILVPASGRPIGGMKEAVLNNVDGVQYAICSNGAVLMDVPEEKSICETGISTEKAVEAIAYLEQFPVAVYVHTDRGTFRAEDGRKQGFLRNILISGSAREM
mgnify:CR=1 FL=1